MSITARISSCDAAILARRSRMAIESIAILFGAALLHYAIHGGSGLWPDNDSPYHVLLMSEIHQQGWWRDVTWLPYTILRDAGPDHHWLWHLLLSPFSAIDDLGTRVDVMNAFNFALVPAASNAALRLLGVRAAPLWVLLTMAATPDILYRWSELRAQNIAWVYLAFFLVALATRQRLALALIAFLFMDSYHGAAMLAAPAAMMFAVGWWRRGEKNWLLLALPAAGGLLALVTSPWYPHDIEYFLFHTLDKVGNALELDVGTEWYPASPLLLLQFLAPQVAVLAIVLTQARSLLRNGLSDATLVALGTALFFVVLSLQHRRFAEYCPQTMMVAAALVVRDGAPLFAGALRRSSLAGVGVLSATLFLGSLLAFAAEHRLDARLRLDRDVDFGRFLAAHANPGDVILNTQWGDFPFLAATAPSLRYVTGLDPYYIAYGSADRFLALARLNGAEPLPPGSVIDVREVFGTDWVVTPRARIVNYLIATGQARAVLMSGREHFLVYAGVDPDKPSRLRRDATPGIRHIYPTH